MRSAGLLIAFAATAAATPIADLESRAIECSNKGLTVRTLQQSVRHPGVFCKWWLNKHATGKVFPKLTVSQTTAACKCVVAHSSLDKSLMLRTVDLTTAQESTPEVISYNFASPSTFCTLWDTIKGRTATPFEQKTPAAKKVYGLCDYFLKKNSTSTSASFFRTSTTSTSTTSTASSEPVHNFIQSPDFEFDETPDSGATFPGWTLPATAFWQRSPDRAMTWTTSGNSTVNLTQVITGIKARSYYSLQFRYTGYYSANTTRYGFRTFVDDTRIWRNSILLPQADFTYGYIHAAAVYMGPPDASNHTLMFQLYSDDSAWVALTDVNFEGPYSTLNAAVNASSNWRKM